MAKKLTEENRTMDVSNIIENLKNEVNLATELDNKIVEQEKEIKSKGNEVFIHDELTIKIKPTKLKYFKDGTYNNFMVIKTLGIQEVLKYGDGEEIIKAYLGAILDKPSSEIDFFDDMSIKNLYEIIEKANIINDIKETDFFNPTGMAEVSLPKE